MLLSNRDLFDEMFSDPFFSRPYDRTSAQIMKTDIHETDSSYVITMELPGYSRDEIKADLKDGYLTITATHTEDPDQTQEKGRCIHKERYTGTCNRSFYVGDDLRHEDIRAGFKDGILTMSFPKETPKEIETPKYISIE